MIDGRPGEMQIKTLIKSIDEASKFSFRKASVLNFTNMKLRRLKTQTEITSAIHLK